MEACRQREEGELYFVLKDWGAIAKLKTYTHLLCIHISSVVFHSYFVSVGVCISEMEVHADYSSREFFLVFEFELIYVLIFYISSVVFLL